MWSKQITDDFGDSVKLFFKYIINDRDILFRSILVSKSHSCDENLYVRDRTKTSKQSETQHTLKEWLFYITEITLRWFLIILSWEELTWAFVPLDVWT